jgi:TonB family protein
MNSKAIKELISAYIDDELSEKEREKVKSLIKSDLRWDMEYKAIKKTALLLSRIEKISVPEDLVKRVSTSIALSKTSREKRQDSKFPINLPRSPIFQYLATVVALGLIVLSGSYFLLMQKNQKEKDYTLALQKEQEWMDSQVAKQDQELLKHGYRWYFLRLEQDGSFQIIHIGESQPKSGDEAVPEKSVTAGLESDKLAFQREKKQFPGSVSAPAPENAKSVEQAPVESKIAPSTEDKGSAAPIQRENLAAAAPKKAAEETPPTAKMKEEVVVVTAEAAKKADSRSSVQEKTTSIKDIKAGVARPESQKPASRTGKNTDDSFIEERESDETSKGRRYRFKDNLSIGSIDSINDEKFKGDIRQVPVPPQPEYLPTIPVKHTGLIKNHVLKVRMELSAEGTVNSVEIISGSGNGWLDSAVKKALMKAKFVKPEITSPDGTVKFDLKIEVK